MSGITRIQQRESWDCGPSAIAMACGVPYDEVLADLLHTMTAGVGINDLHLDDWCYRHRFAWQRIYQNHPVNGHYVKRAVWPPKPFAPTHIAQVEATAGWHFTVMDNKGVVHDPWTAERTTLNHPDYRSVSWVMGLWPIPNTEGER